MITQQFILEVWKRLGTHIVGAAELTQIQEAIAESSGGRRRVEISPAAIARILADHGAQLKHPEILEADASWRERQEAFSLADPFLNDSSLLRPAVAFIEKLKGGEFEDEESFREDMRQCLLKVKSEFELIAANENDLAGEWSREVSQWLTVMLENPQIARDWVALRTATPEYQDLVRRYEELARQNAQLSAYVK